MSYTPTAHNCTWTSKSIMSWSLRLHPQYYGMHMILKTEFSMQWFPAPLQYVAYFITKNWLLPLHDVIHIHEITSMLSSCVHICTDLHNTVISATTCKTPRKQGRDESVMYIGQRESKRGSYCLWQHDPGTKHCQECCPPRECVHDGDLHWVEDTPLRRG